MGGHYLGKYGRLKYCVQDRRQKLGEKYFTEYKVIYWLLKLFLFYSTMNKSTDGNDVGITILQLKKEDFPNPYLVGGLCR